MSDTLAGALIGAGALLCGLVASQLANFLVEQRRELASYRVNLYAKRLEVHQEAYKWLMDIIEPAMKANLSPGGDPGILGLVDSLYVGARKWWDGNCLYLDDVSRIKVVDFLEAVRDISEGVVQDQPPLHVMFRSALDAVVTGIGMKHLDVREPRRHVG